MCELSESELAALLDVMTPSPASGEGAWVESVLPIDDIGYLTTLTTRAGVCTVILDHAYLEDAPVVIRLDGRGRVVALAEWPRPERIVDLTVV